MPLPPPCDVHPDVQRRTRAEVAVTRARIAHRCPTCGAPPLFRCKGMHGRTRATLHPDRLALAHAEYADAPDCPATSPERGTPCALPDLEDWHPGGMHLARLGAGVTVSWEVAA